MDAMDAWFLDDRSEHSAHFGIGLDGRVHQYVDVRDRAWANGTIEAGSAWPGPAGVNPNHVTVSIETEDLGDASQVVTEAQYQATLAAARMTLKQYPKIRYLVTHRAISPETRSADPGARWIRSGRFAALAAELGLEPIP
jgi:N-acetyl-anhydromuramyl-L-alanine amidase AmpD